MKTQPVAASGGGTARSVVFYDGDCALCHGFVRFLLRRDGAAHRFDYSPLGGEYVKQVLTERERAALPDSIVLRTADGTLRMRSDAVLAALDVLGGFWKGMAAASRIVPRPARDAAYDFIAQRRKKVFGTTAAACPIVPPALRDRFLG